MRMKLADALALTRERAKKPKRKPFRAKQIYAQILENPGIEQREFGKTASGSILRLCAEKKIMRIPCIVECEKTYVRTYRLYRYNEKLLQHSLRPHGYWQDNDPDINKGHGERFFNAIDKMIQNSAVGKTGHTRCPHKAEIAGSNPARVLSVSVALMVERPLCKGKALGSNPGGYMLQQHIHNPIIPPNVFSVAAPDNYPSAGSAAFVFVFSGGDSQGLPVHNQEASHNSAATSPQVGSGTGAAIPSFLLSSNHQSDTGGLMR